MSHEQYAQQILALLRQPPTMLPPMRADERRRKNAARCMAALACNRLAQSGELPQHKRHSMLSWNGGVIGLRNSRVANQFWTNLFPSVEEELNTLGQEQPVACLLMHWDVDDSLLHAWAVPEKMFFMQPLRTYRQTSTPAGRLCWSRQKITC